MRLLARTCAEMRQILQVNARSCGCVARLRVGAGTSAKLRGASWTCAHLRDVALSPVQLCVCGVPNKLRELARMCANLRKIVHSCAQLRGLLENCAQPRGVARIFERTGADLRIAARTCAELREFARKCVLVVSVSLFLNFFQKCPCAAAGWGGGWAVRKKA